PERARPRGGSAWVIPLHRASNGYVSERACRSATATFRVEGEAAAPVPLAGEGVGRCSLGGIGGTEARAAYPTSCGRAMKGADARPCKSRSWRSAPGARGGLGRREALVASGSARAAEVSGGGGRLQRDLARRERPGVLDVLAGEALGAFGVAVADGLVDALVLAEGLAARSPVEVGVVAAHAQLQVLQGVGEKLVADGLGDQHVEAAVDARILDQVALLDRAVAGGDQLAQLREVRLGAALRREARGIRLEDAAHLEHLLELAARQRAHVGAAPRARVEPARGLERLDRLAYRDLADAEVPRDVVDQQALARHQHVGEDRLEQHLIDVI